MDFVVSRKVMVRCRLMPACKLPFYVTIFKKPDGAFFAVCDICDNGQNGSVCADCWLYVRRELERDPYQSEL